jgi:hypothetical protein
VLFVDRKIGGYALPVAVFPVVFPFAFYLSQALFRYRYPIDPVVMLLTAIAAGALWRKVSVDGRKGPEIRTREARRSPPSGNGKARPPVFNGEAKQPYS